MEGAAISIQVVLIMKVAIVIIYPRTLNRRISTPFKTRISTPPLKTEDQRPRLQGLPEDIPGLFAKKILETVDGQLYPEKGSLYAKWNFYSRWHFLASFLLVCFHKA